MLLVLRTRTIYNIVNGTINFPCERGFNPEIVHFRIPKKSDLVQFGLRKHEPSIFEFTEHFLRTTLKFEISKTDIEISEKEDKTSKKILECIIENPKITSSMLAIKLDISKSATDKQLANLKKLGKIRRIGSTKADSWDIL